MKNRSFKTIAAIAMTAAALGLSACSSDSEDTSAAGDTSTTAFESENTGGESDTGASIAETPAPNLPKPTPEELNDRVNKALNGQLSDSEKLTYIENADRDPDLVDKFVTAAKENKVTVKIVSVDDPADGKLKANADVTIDGAPVEGATVQFVAQGSDWKVSNTFACSIVKSAKLDSAACQSA
ncbi:hypothetical protein BOX37_20935 [Nocardia mangyaensis]|uniref:Low molecular weight antigen MTB12-like C-terminal domain-containing protein n=1 Tax=Nocardia mangyaensis TaxID=2213200 RepID=A0A1J0VVA8_9NOCA|nr:hypothetical protein [Nocardia mangyaensis]APE35988.1 hypothetical protein BOX37_20935 [Nocardia mangyaensis]